MADLHAQQRWQPRQTMILIVVALVAVVFPIFLVSALSPMIGEDLGLDETTLGVAMSVYMLAGATVSLPVGRMIDRRGATMALRIGLLIVTCIAIGITVTVERGGHLIAWMALGGTAIGFVDNGSARVIAAVTPVRRQGLAFGIKEAAIPTASMLAGAAVPLLAATVGWRAAFAGAAVLACTVAIIVPRDVDRSQTAQSPGASAGRPPPGAAQAADLTSVASPAPTSDASATWSLAALAVAATLGGASASAAATFLVPATVDVGFVPATAGVVLAIASAAGITVRVVLGAAADRVQGAELSILAGALALGAVGVLGLSLLSGPMFILAAMIALGAGWGWTGLMFFAAVRVVPDRPARAASTVLVGLAGGGGAGPLLFGPLVAAVGFGPAWLYAAIIMAVAAGIVGGLAQQRARRRIPAKAAQR